MRIVVAFVLCCLAFPATSARAQVADSTSADSLIAVTPAPSSVQSKPPLRERVYYGGSVIFSFGDVTRIGVYPMIAYKFTPKLSLGMEVGYEWLKYDDIDQSGSNYGGSVFSIYRLLPQIYARAEYQLTNYEIFTSPTTSERDWVPFLLLGGGLSQQVGPGTWAYLEVLFDVLNDDHSPYDKNEPFISAGVSVGF